jgi:hypothetical protein
MNIANIATLPTNNLYKFLALSGMAILIISGVAPWYFRRKVIEKVIASTIKLAKYKYKLNIDSLEDDWDGVQNQIDRLRKVIEEHKNKLASGMAAGDGSSSDVERLFGDLYTKDRSIKKRLFKRTLLSELIKTTHLEVKLLAIEQRDVKRAQIAGLIFGCLLVVVGFSLWYSKTQYYLDKQLREQVNHSGTKHSPSLSSTENNLAINSADKHKLPSRP